MAIAKHTIAIAIEPKKIELFSTVKAVTEITNKIANNANRTIFI